MQESTSIHNEREERFSKRFLRFFVVRDMRRRSDGCRWVKIWFHTVSTSRDVERTNGTPRAAHPTACSEVALISLSCSSSVSALLCTRRPSMRQRNASVFEEA